MICLYIVTVVNNLLTDVTPTLHTKLCEEQTHNRVTFVVMVTKIRLPFSYDQATEPLGQVKDKLTFHLLICGRKLKQANAEFQCHTHMNTSLPCVCVFHFSFFTTWYLDTSVLTFVCHQHKKLNRL